MFNYTIQSLIGNSVEVEVKFNYSSEEFVTDTSSGHPEILEIQSISVPDIIGVEINIMEDLSKDCIERLHKECIESLKE